MTARREQEGEYDSAAIENRTHRGHRGLFHHRPDAAQEAAARPEIYAAVAPDRCCHAGPGELSGAPAPHRKGNRHPERHEHAVPDAPGLRADPPDDADLHRVQADRTDPGPGAEQCAPGGAPAGAGGGADGRGVSSAADRGEGKRIAAPPVREGNPDVRHWIPGEGMSGGSETKNI